MNHIILDLEFNTPYKTNYGATIKNEDCPDEIMEIGAIKLDDTFKQIDSFRMFIKPTFYKRVGVYVCKKTGITIDDLTTGGIEFTRAIDIFLKWVGNDSQLYTWSDNDYRTMQSNCNFFSVSYKWFNGYIDLQEDYRIFSNEDTGKSLSKTLNYLRIPMLKDVHLGLNDAIYTGEVLKYMNGIEIPRISKENGVKESTKEDCMIMRCPICENIIEAEYESKKYNQKKKYLILGTCKDCNAPIYHLIERHAIEIYSHEFNYITETKIVKKAVYNSFKRNMFQNVKV